VWKVAVQPGKPIGFGRIGAAPWLGLPGNPVSSLVTLLVFGVPLIRRLQGREPLLPAAVAVPAGFGRDRVNKREEYVRVSLRDGALIPYRHQGSGVLSSMAHADGLARIPAHTQVREGDALAYTSFSEYLG
jgi:molybdopterin molybdotransferase